MIALPVLAVTAADVVIQTAEVSGEESLDRRLGAADARVDFQPGSGRVYQGFDPDGGSRPECSTSATEPSPSRRDASRAGRDVRLPPSTGTAGRASTPSAAPHVEATETDPADPLADGLFELTDGRCRRRPARWCQPGAGRAWVRRR